MKIVFFSFFSDDPPDSDGHFADDSDPESNGSSLPNSFESAGENHIYQCRFCF